MEKLRTKKNLSSLFFAYVKKICSFFPRYKYWGCELKSDTPCFHNAPFNDGLPNPLSTLWPIDFSLTRFISDAREKTKNP